jgi:TonB-dependent siderophore receptor
MWKKTLIAAAIAGMAVPARAAEPASEPEKPKDSADSQPDDTSVELAPVQVEGRAESEGLKADTQTSAAKIPLSVRETPQSVTVITQESLRDRQVFDLGQALEMSAGVNQFSGTGPFGGRSSFGFSDVTIRGITIDGYNDVREDGFINNSYFTMPDMAIYDRVEVVKGPNAVTYGRGSVGGLINRVRKKPLAEEQTDVELSVGSFDTYRVDLDTTGPLFSSHRVRGRLVAAYDDEGSFVHGVDSRRAVAAPSLDVDLTPSTRLLVEGLAQIDRFTSNTGFPLVPNGDGSYRAPNISRSTFVGVPTDDGNHWSIYSGALQLDQDLSDRWLATLRLSGNRTENHIRNDRYAYGFYEGNTSLNSSAFDIGNTIWSGELRLSGDVDVAGLKLKLAAGAELSDNDYHRRGSYLPYPFTLGYVNIYKGNFADLPSQPLTDSYQFGGKDKNQGYYVQAQIRPIDRLRVLLGGRYDRTDSTFNSQTSGANYGKKDDAFTGRIGLTYDLTRQISAYTLYAQSFLPTLYAFDQNGNVLDPETGEIYEVGLKTEWFAGRLGLNTAVYRIDREHIPTQVPVPPGQTPYSISSGLQRSQGAELEINGELLPGWKLSMAYDVLSSKFKDPNDPLYGAKPAGTANWQYSMFTSYELQSGALHGLGAGLSLFAIPQRGLSTYQRGTLDGYDRVDLHLFYKGLRDLEFRLTVRNLMDERYVEGADRIGGNAQFGSPRAALLSVRYSMGAH